MDGHILNNQIKHEFHDDIYKKSVWDLLHISVHKNRPGKSD